MAQDEWARDDEAVSLADSDEVLEDLAPPRGQEKDLQPKSRHGATEEEAAVAALEQAALFASLSNAGGIAGHAALRAGRSAVSAPSVAERLAVTEQAVTSLFGKDRAALLRLPAGSVLCGDFKALRQRSAAATVMREKGQDVPSNWNETILFWTFQFDRNRLLATSPLSIEELEAWAWAQSRWLVAQAGDMSSDTDFKNVLGLADKLAKDLDAAESSLDDRHGAALDTTLLGDIHQLFIHFAKVRAAFTADMARVALRNRLLEPAHRHYQTLQRIYAHDYATVPQFLESVDKHISTQSRCKFSRAAREDYISKARICLARACISGLSGGPAPAPNNPLDLADGVGPRARAQPATCRSAASDAGSSPSHPSSGLPSPAISSYTTIQQPLPTADFDMGLGGTSRPPALGSGDLGAQLRSLLGGTTNGPDLEEARRVLLVAQLLSGSRNFGGSGLAGFHAGAALPAPPAYAPPTPLPLPAMAPAAARGHHGGGRPARSRHDSDELHVPWSSGLLGGFSPYRLGRLPDACFECGTPNQHFATECPRRFARVLGEVPPGWRIDGPSTVTKDPSSWAGSDLTAEARAQYRPFIQKFALQPSHVSPVSIEDITGLSPPAPRRALGPGRR